MGFGAWAFALHLDVAARVAETVAQAGGATHDAQRFVDGAVGVVQAEAIAGAVAAGIQAVDVEVVDGVTARDVVVVAVGTVAVFLEVDAGGVGNGFTDGVKLLLFHAFLCRDRDGLRGFAQGKVKSRGRDAARDGVVGFL